MEKQFTRSTRPMIFQITGIIVVGIILFIFTTTVFRTIDNIMPWDWSSLTRFARIIVLGAILLGVLLIRLNAKKEQYSLTNTAIVVSRNGLGRHNQDIYNLKNITSLSVRQPLTGGRLNYGHVIINMDKLEQNSRITLSNVIEPRKVADAINDAKSKM